MFIHLNLTKTKMALKNTNDLLPMVLLILMELVLNSQLEIECLVQVLASCARTRRLRTCNISAYMRDSCRHQIQIWRYISVDVYLAQLWTVNWARRGRTGPNVASCAVSASKNVADVSCSRPLTVVDRANSTTWSKEPSVKELLANCLAPYHLQHYNYYEVFV